MNSQPWQQFSLKRQLQVALRVARQRAAQWRRKYPNVLAVGAGLRSRSGSIVQGEVCLRFLVSRKRKARGRSDIPYKIDAYVTVGRSKRRVQIPTDVSEFSGGRPHSELAAGIVSVAGSTPFEMGAACCLVRDGGNPPTRYLMTCYHVFAPDMQVVTTPMSCLSSGTNRPLGKFAPDENVAAPGDSLDVGLIVVGGGFGNLTLWGRSITTRATDFDLHSLVQGEQLFVCARVNVPTSVAAVPPRTGPLPATFQSVFPSIPCNYPQAGAIFTFPDVIEYSADVYPGDSGAALINDSGKLYGMHFYATNQFAYALSAPRLFDPDVFTSDIRL